MRKFTFILIFLIFLPKITLAVFGPRAFITEYVLAHFHPNGSIDINNTFPPCNSNPCRYGLVEVSIPNNDDVLQQVRINLSSTANTNLQSNVAYKNFLSSYPIANSKNNIYVNTTLADPAEYYNITNPAIAPTITLSIDVKNLAGGYDIFDDDNVITKNNTLNFTLNASNPGTVDLNNSKIVIQFKRDLVGTNDVINVSNPLCNTGSCSREDSDSDGYFDKIVWTVNLTKSSSFILQFNGIITSGLNFPDSSTAVNLDNDKGVTANYSKNLTFTGISIEKKIAKASVRQGVDMVQNSTSGKWLVRGYIVNTANSDVGIGEYTLTYNVTSWRLYIINETTGEPIQYVQSGNFTSAIIAPNEILFTTDSRSSNTSWHDSGSTTKPFYGSYFEWEVIWNSTNSENYLAFSNSTLDMPTLYKIDMINEKSLSGSILPNTPNDVITVTDRVMHAGSSNLPTDFIQIISVIPVNTTNNSFHGKFTINNTSIKFYFDNTTLGGSTYELTTGPYASITLIDPASDGSHDGIVNLTITNLSSVSFASGGVVGHGLRPNEKIKLVFDVLDNESMTFGDTYNFTGNSTLKTKSGTPLTEYHPMQTISVTAAGPSIQPLTPPSLVPSLEFEETNTITCIYEDRYVTIKITQSDRLKIQEISMLFTRTKCPNGQIKVKEASLPFNIRPPISKERGSVLKYLDISKTNIQDEDIAKVKIKFKVDKGWISNNNIDANTVSLQKFDKEWKKLTTIKIGEDSKFVYYEAESNSLSLFAIVGEKRILTLEYPEYIKLNRGQSSLIQIFVRNDGNEDLNNLVLFTSDSVLLLEIKPIRLNLLEPNSSFIFLISVKVPKDVSTGIYPINFILASDKITKQGEIKVEVGVLKIELEIEQSIKNYELSIENLMIEANKATKEGKNVSLVISVLNEAKSELEIAKKLYESNDYLGAKEKLEDVRELIEQATIQLAQTIGPKIIFVPVPIPRPDIILSLSGTIGLSVYYYYRQKKENEKYRKSIRKIIQIIKNRRKK